MTDNESITVEFKQRNQPFNEDDFIKRTRAMSDRLDTGEDPKLLRQTYWTESERQTFQEIEETPTPENKIKQIVGDGDLFKNLVQRIAEKPKSIFEWADNSVIFGSFKRSHLISMEALQKIGDSIAHENKFFNQCQPLSETLKKATPEDIDAAIKRASKPWTKERKPKPPSR